MLARIIVACGISTALAAACSNPAAERVVEVDPTFQAELELALFGSPTAAQVVSPLELSRVAEAEPASNSPPRLRPSAPSAGVALLGDPVERVEMPAPAVVLVSEPIAAAPAPAGRGGDDRAATGAGRLPTIIIRGGVSERDPCRIHLPGSGSGSGVLGVIGVLINDRTPRDAGLYDPRNRPGGGGIPVSGPVFRGGIR